jgi:hypothetical protein
VDERKESCFDRDRFSGPKSLTVSLRSGLYRGS